MIWYILNTLFSSPFAIIFLSCMYRWFILWFTMALMNLFTIISILGTFINEMQLVNLAFNSKLWNMSHILNLKKKYWKIREIDVKSYYFLHCMYTYYYCTYFSPIVAWFDSLTLAMTFWIPLKKGLSLCWFKMCMKLV